MNIEDFKNGKTQIWIDITTEFALKALHGLIRQVFNVEGDVSLFPSHLGKYVGKCENDMFQKWGWTNEGYDNRETIPLSSLIYKKEHKEILDKISNYLSQPGAEHLRFWQALFNMDVLIFEDPKMANDGYTINDDYNISDRNLLHRIKSTF